MSRREPVIPRRLTSGVPVSPDLSPAEAATVARFEAAPDAEESLRERVAEALHTADARGCGLWRFCPVQDHYRTQADAAIAVIRGDDA